MRGRRYYPTALGNHPKKRARTSELPATPDATSQSNSPSPDSTSSSTESSSSHSPAPPINFNTYVHPQPLKDGVRIGSLCKSRIGSHNYMQHVRQHYKFPKSCSIRRNSSQPPMPQCIYPYCNPKKSITFKNHYSQFLCKHPNKNANVRVIKLPPRAAKPVDESVTVPQATQDPEQADEFLE